MAPYSALTQRPVFIRPYTAYLINSTSSNQVCDDDDDDDGDNDDDVDDEGHFASNCSRSQYSLSIRFSSPV